MCLYLTVLWFGQVSRVLSNLHIVRELYELISLCVLNDGPENISIENLFWSLFIAKKV